MSKMTVDKFKQDSEMRKQFHYHKIDWGPSPIERKDFDWVDDNILNNESEFPFFQFSISAGTGRVLGYFDVDSTFQVLLLDPLHNLNPSKYVGYKVQPTTFGKCQYTMLIEQTERIVSYTKSQGVDIPEGLWGGNIDALTDEFCDVLIVRVCSETVRAINELVSNAAIETSGEIIREAVMSYTKEVSGILET